MPYNKAYFFKKKMEICSLHEEDLEQYYKNYK